MPGLKSCEVKATLIYLDMRNKLLKYMDKYLIGWSDYNFGTANKLIFRSTIEMRYM